MGNNENKDFDYKEIEAEANENSINDKKSEIKKTKLPNGPTIVGAKIPAGAIGMFSEIINDVMNEILSEDDEEEDDDDEQNEKIRKIVNETYLSRICNSDCNYDFMKAKTSQYEPDLKTELLDINVIRFLRATSLSNEFIARNSLSSDDMNSTNSGGNFFSLPVEKIINTYDDESQAILSKYDHVFVMFADTNTSNTALYTILYNEGKTYAESKISLTYISYDNKFRLYIPAYGNIVGNLFFNNVKFNLTLKSESFFESVAARVYMQRLIYLLPAYGVAFKVKEDDVINLGNIATYIPKKVESVAAEDSERYFIGCGVLKFKDTREALDFKNRYTFLTKYPKLYVACHSEVPPNVVGLMQILNLNNFYEKSRLEIMNNNAIYINLNI